MTIVHFGKLTIKLILLVVLLPFVAVWAFVRYRIFRFSLISEMTKANMPVDYAKELAREMSIGKLFSGVFKRGRALQPSNFQFTPSRTF